MHDSNDHGRAHLCNLLGYAEEVLKMGERIVSDLAKDAVLSIYEHEIMGLEGVSAPVGEDSWLRVSRLREIQAPETPADYLPWLAKAGAAPFDRPRLSETHLVRVTPEEVSDLLEAGLAGDEDVLQPVTAEGTDAWAVQVLLRLDRLPEFQAAFVAWVAGPWSDWADAERPRRRCIGYYNRLFEVQQRMAAMGDDVAVEVVFGVGLARWIHPLGKINAPLIEAVVELELDPGDGSIVVRARQQSPRLALRPFDAIEIEGVGKLQRDAAGQLERLYNDPDVGFSPHERGSFEIVLRMCQARLFSAAVYERDARPNEADRTPPQADEKLRITDTWVVYVRQRSVNFRCEDIRKLSTKIREARSPDELPSPGLQMISRPNDSRVDDDIVDLGSGALVMPTASHVEWGSRPASPARMAEGKSRQERAFFFPLPFNDDQIEIVRRLEEGDESVVVVQGPPGTGKTHTIANIIAHYMATGRRVLVSAHEPEALAAIQHKLPEGIRDLAIAVIHSDREGARQLEHAVDILASQVKQIDKRAYNDSRVEAEIALSETRAGLAETDERIRSYALENMTAVEYGGARLMPMELAVQVEAGRSLHDWLPDTLGMTPAFEPRFHDGDISEARVIRGELGPDICYAAGQLPDPSTLPDVPRLLAAHEALVSEREHDNRAAAGDLPFVSFGPGAGMEKARALYAWLDDLRTWAAEAEVAAPWLTGLFRQLLGSSAAADVIHEGVRQLCGEWASIYRDGQAFLLRGIEVPGGTGGEPPFMAAVEALATGRKPFGLFSFGQSGLKAKIEAVRIEGSPPAGTDAWTCVHAFLLWERRAQGFARRWSAAAKAADLPPLPAEPDELRSHLLKLGKLVERKCAFHAEASIKLEELSKLFPHGVDHRRVVLWFETKPILEALSVSLSEDGHAEALSVRQQLDRAASDGKLPFQSAVLSIREALGDPGVPSREIAEGWREVLAEARRLHLLHGRRTRLEAVAENVAASGAPGWASALLEQRAEADDPWTPSTWRASWDWARANGHMRGIAGRNSFAALCARREALELKQRELLGEIVRLRTFIGLKQGITERVASALTKFGMKVRQLGAGTGKSAERHRRAIREATLDASEAVPCWILPEWRVAEQLPSELATFDLVIIDEASQSDITSLPTVLRGKKLLVVGDDKQVSPSAIGMEEKTVVQLRETFLRGMDIANYLEPTTSLYDFASITCPGSVLMLREHFRCVEPIIRFSSRFYPKALIPLRVATAEERLDPPLVDIFVPHGRKHRDVNEAEAAVIVEEIARLTATPEYVSRSIGVISLIGDKQAKLIQERLTAAVGTEAVSRHRIMCGNASTFQGQERDIVFLSMVACPSTARAQTARLMEQRFNVALSRARDRMYLVRSIPASLLSPADLKSLVIEHFRNPMDGATVAHTADILEACESGFERDVGKCLLDLGYRVRPQVQVGPFRIDFVVEGDRSRRLAVELDGDRYHGPERWAEDQDRQRALERLGWVFWRCWGSHWLSDRQGSLDDLLATLSRLGIEPVGGDFSPQVWTEHRVAADPAATGVTAVATTAEQADHPDVAKVDGAIVELPAEDADLAGPAPDAASHDNEAIVEAGDTVIVRFADDNRVRRFRLSRESHDPNVGVVHVAQPIGEALLGNGVEEELELLVGGVARRVIIEKITKAA